MKYPIPFYTVVTCLLYWGLGTAEISLAQEGLYAMPQRGGASAPFFRRARTNSTDRLIVKYRETAVNTATVTAMSQRVSQITGYGMNRIGRMHNGAQILKLQNRLPLTELRGIMDEIKGSADIEYVEPDLLMLPLYTPNDPRYNEQWHYYENVGGIALPEAWDITQGANTVVAVVDSGYLPHQDLLPNLLPGYDLIRDSSIANDGNGRDSNARDPGDYAPDCGASQSSWHGTHVAGTIAAVGNNGVGVTGVAFRARILPVRVLGKCGGYLSDIADGIAWASGASVTGVPVNTQPAQVINLSLGGPSSTCPRTLQAAIDTARQRGASVVVAAGNESQDSSRASPANCNGVISVAATTRTGSLAPFSNFGPKVDIAAPGTSVLSTYNQGRFTPGGDSYTSESGTSMSAPHVSGVAALLYAVKPGITPNEVETILKATARPFPNSCYQCGAGILDAAAAVAEASKSSQVPADSGVELLENGTRKTGLSGSRNEMLRFAIDVPAGTTQLSFVLQGGSGDADLYVRFGEAPTLSRFDCRPYWYGNSEVCRIGNIQAGRYHVMLYGYAAFSATTLTASY